MLKKQQSTIAQQESTIAQLGKKSVKKEKRKPSEYNLFLKGKMTQGMSMNRCGQSMEGKRKPPHRPALQ